MPVRKAIAEKDGVYFITFTCTNRFPLFKICNAYDAVYNWFNHLKEQRHYIIGYVIMPSHVHAIIAFSNTDKTINGIVSNGKRFIAYELIKRLTKQNSSLILNDLSNGLNNTERKEGKLHGVFETSFDWKECRTEKFIQQKLDYIHWNPCKGNKLAEVPEQYIHSSAKFYIVGEQGIYTITSFMELRDIDLTASRK
jgi:REP element-mobilizing transposase RayT